MNMFSSYNRKNTTRRSVNTQESTTSTTQKKLTMRAKVGRRPTSTLEKFSSRTGEKWEFWFFWKGIIDEAFKNN